MLLNPLEAVFSRLSKHALSLQGLCTSPPPAWRPSAEHAAIYQRLSFYWELKTGDRVFIFPVCECINWFHNLVSSAKLRMYSVSTRPVTKKFNRTARTPAVLHLLLAPRQRTIHEPLPFQPDNTAFLFFTFDFPSMSCNVLRQIQEYCERQCSLWESRKTAQSLSTSIFFSELEKFQLILLE